MPLIIAADNLEPLKPAVAQARPDLGGGKAVKKPATSAVKF